MNLKRRVIYGIFIIMKRISIFSLIFIFVFLISLLVGVGIFGVAENEVTITQITKINADGERIDYDATYSRDIIINYQFQTAERYFVRVYAKENVTYTLIRTTDYQVVVDGKGEYRVEDNGDLRIDCIACNALGEEIGELSQIIKSDVVAPLMPEIDTDGTMDVSHSVAFSVGYIINPDELSGIDFSRSYYRYEDLDGNEIIGKTIIHQGYDKALVSGINQNGKLIFTIYDKAGNFTVAEKSYTLHYYVNSTAPTITVTPSTEYSPNVMVTLSWPMGVTYKYYKVIANGYELGRKVYTAPFSITQEGRVEVLAYYYENGEETFVSKTITNVDGTAPEVSSIAESIGVKVDLTSNEPVVLSLKPRDLKSGVKRVYLKNFGTEFNFDGFNVYSLGVVERLGTVVVIVVEDFAGNKTEYNYPLNGYDKEKILHYNDIYTDLSENDYDARGWDQVIHEYSRLSFLLSSADSSSGDILSYSKVLDSAIEGKYSVKVTIVDIIDGLNNDFTVNVPINATSIKKGGALKLLVNKIDVSEAEFNEKISIGSTIAKFPHYTGFGFNLSLLDNEDKDVTFYNQINVSLTIPGTGKLAKVYYEKDGILHQLSSSIENNVLTFQAENDGNFYLIVESDFPKEQGKGLNIGGKFYPLNLLLITGGIILGAILLVGILTPILYKVIKNKRDARKKFNYLR